MAKYRYQLFVNEKKMTKTKREFIYKYRNTNNIKIIIDKNCACVDVNMGVKKEFSDLSDVKFDVMIDALKKIYLLHILIFKQGLKIKSIRLQRNDEDYSYDESDERFPFVFSMVEDTKYDFNDTWSSESMINSILTTTKSARIENNKFICLYAYLTAKSKRYRVDRFTNLWMSFNAYYDYNGKKAGKKGDKTCVEYLLQCIGHGTNNRTKAFRDDNKQLYSSVGSELASIKQEDYCDFYNRLYRKEDIEEFEKLHMLAGDRMTLYGAILCEYAYYIRCKYFHGGKTITLLSTYNEYEVSVFKVISYFLERFLEEKIPEMFEEEVC